MRMSQFTPVILGVFLFVAIFGLPLMLSHSEHHTVCPLQGVQMVMCENTVIDHVSMWQAMFASFLTLCVFVCSVLVVGVAPTPAVARIRLKWRIAPDRPTLLQELFSNGILNRKEPHLFS